MRCCRNGTLRTLEGIPDSYYIMSFGAVVIKLRASKEPFQSISSERGFEQSAIEFFQSIER